MLTLAETQAEGSPSWKSFLSHIHPDVVDNVTRLIHCLPNGIVYGVGKTHLDLDGQTLLYIASELERFGLDVFVDAINENSGRRIIWFAHWKPAVDTPARAALQEIIDRNLRKVDKGWQCTCGVFANHNPFEHQDGCPVPIAERGLRPETE